MLAPKSTADTEKRMSRFIQINFFMEKFRKFALTSVEQKNIKGGDWSCQCNGVGTWTGNYSTTDQVINAINTYCSGGGRCAQL